MLEQIKPWCDDIRIFNTHGKPKELSPPAEGSLDGLAGAWSLEIQTPFGQDIPARLTLVESSEGYTGRIESEMGAGDLVDIKLSGQEFRATLAFEMDGHAVTADIQGTAEGRRLQGNISLQNLQPLPFTGARED